MFFGVRRTVNKTFSGIKIGRGFYHRVVPLFFARLAGDWACACGFSNFASRDVCFQCHRSRPIARQSALGDVVATTQRTKFRSGDWMCACGVHNFAKRESCVSCDAPRLGGGGQQQQAKGPRLLPGDWVCEKCHLHNFRGRKKCLQCGWVPAKNDSSGVDGGSETKHQTWTCLACHTVNEHHAVACEVCCTPCKTKSAGFLPALARPDDWLCERCGFLNFSSRARCKKCTTACASVGEATDPSLWICGCGYKNFRHRDSCRECGALKAS